MEKLKNSIKEQLMLMERFSLTAEEFLAIEMLFYSKDAVEVDTLVLYNNLPIEKSGFSEILKNLKQKGVLDESFKIPNKGESFDVMSLPFSEKFQKAYKKSSGELGQELYEAYPFATFIDGELKPQRCFDQFFKSKEEMCFEYGKAICWSQERHQEVLDLIKWAKDHDHFGIRMSLGSFITNRMWESIKLVKDNM